MKKNLFSNKLSAEFQETKEKSVHSSSDKWLWLASGAACLVFVIIVAQLLDVGSKKPVTPANKVANPAKSTTSEVTIALPLVSDVPADSVVREDPNFQADQLVFSQIYQKPTTTWSLDILTNKAQAVNLPINIKKDVVNYYDIRRYYNLEPIINQLNEQGSVLVDNPFDSPKQDFFDFYRSAQANHWPLLLTSDVIFYYYQNNIKDVYKAVEAGFYDDLWQISNGLFKMANQRYQAAISQAIKGNDPILEAYRLNAQYWAVALKLLAPQARQIDKGGNINNSIIFQVGDDQIYRLPSIDEDLCREVDQEVALIKEASGVKLSPLFGYEIDYSSFMPDTDYQGGGRLANFSLASQWLGHTWPLYYREADCPKCLLDIDDWRVNFLAANILARDLNSDQEFKNNWAKIYKVISYFSGLRDELTYVHYVKAQKDILGDQSLEAIAHLDETSRNQILERLRAAILNNEFPKANGGWNRQNQDDQPKIGLRVLQDHYWPGQSINWSAVGPKLDVFLNEQTTTDWQVNQFWSSIDMLREWFNTILVANKEWVRPSWWKSQHLALGKFYLVNWQLPSDQRRVALPDSSLVQDNSTNESLVSIDTASLPAVDQQIALAKMLRLALAKLQASNLLSEQKLVDTINTLEMIKNLAIKQSAGQSWTKEESQAMNIFFQSAIVKAGRKTLTKSPKDNSSLQKIQARIEVRMIGGQPYLLIGPVIIP